MKLSCIYLATANLKWMIETSIPLLIKNINKNKYTYEIIIIFNGFKEENESVLNKLSQYPLYYSDPLWVAKGYNLGAQMANGEYLVFFHDDSAVKSPYWLDTIFEEFNNNPNTAAISSELGKIDLSPFRLKEFNFLKCTPLVINKNKFYEAGCFDENYLFGFEDIDFSFSIVKKGQNIKKVNFDYEHKKGSSTVSILGSLKDFYKEFNFINLNTINAEYFAKKYNLPFHIQLSDEEKKQFPDLETLNNNKKDFVELIKANYFLNKNKMGAAKLILDKLSGRYNNNLLFQEVTKKLI